MKDKKHSPRTIRLMSEAQRRLWNDPVKRANWSTAQRRRHPVPIHLLDDYNTVKRKGFTYAEALEIVMRRPGQMP